MWLYAGSGRWQEAEAIYNNWPERVQEFPLNLEEISIMYASQGKCELSLEALRKAHGSDVKIYGEISPNAGRSNSNLALNRVHCLRQLQRLDEADEILARVRNYVGTLRQNTVYGFYMIDAKLHVLDGNIEGALDILEAAEKRGEIEWTERYDPILRTLSDEPRFVALFQRIDDDIDAMRAELGLPPALR
jgi:tetratricopeptide (TPR) repeat protein